MPPWPQPPTTPVIMKIMDPKVPPNTTKMGMTLSDFVVTEAGFGSDLGAEKFFDIKCAGAGLSPDGMVLVATIRALKYHGGADLKTLTEPNVDAVVRGLVNLEKHLENTKLFKIPAVVAINRFTTETDEEIEAWSKKFASNLFSIWIHVNLFGSFCFLKIFNL